MTDRTAFLTVNLAQALLERAFPTITTWNRLEGRPRTLNFNRGLKAEARDALWMLTKQWQLGEFQGDDAGSPIAAKVRLTQSRLRNYRAGTSGAVEDFDVTIPLETKVERRPIAFTLDIDLLLGRQWLKMLPVPALRAEYIRQYPIHAPDPTVAADAKLCAHQEVWSEFAAHVGRAMSGAALYRHLTVEGGTAADGIAGAAGHETELAEAATRFLAWFEQLVALPSGSDAWEPDRLEYQFACSAPDAPGQEKVLVAGEYYQGHIDWYSTDLAATKVLGSPPADPLNPTTIKRAMVPVPASFSGMPNTRYWQFEDGQTNFGDIKPDTTDLAKLLLIEFGLVYANDWFVVPFTLPAASVVRVDGVAVTNVFGERLWVDPAGSRSGDVWQRWAMFLEDGAAGAPVTDQSLVLFPSATKVDDARPVERVMLIRDEMANMVWAVEDTVPLATGESKRGIEAARETRAFFEQRLPPPPPPPAPVAPIRYELMNSVPENWIPFIPVHVPGDNRSIQLQRAALLRTLPGDPLPPVKVEPRTSLIREGLADGKAYFLHEEEVPRAGVVVTQHYRRTRWRDGRAWLWFGARKQTGRGEGASGLAFDRIAR